MLVFTGVGIRDVTAVTILCNRLLDGEIQPSARFQVLLAMFVEIKVLCRVRITQWWLIHLPTFRESVVFSILLDCLTLNMEALGHSRTPIATQRSRRSNIREGLNFHPASSLMWRRSITAKEEEWHFTKFWLAHVLTTKVTVRLCPDVLATFLFISCAGICRNFISTLLLLFFPPPPLESYRDCNFSLSLRKIYISFFSDVMDYLWCVCLSHRLPHDFCHLALPSVWPYQSRFVCSLGCTHITTWNSLYCMLCEGMLDWRTNLSSVYCFDLDF